MSRMHRHMAIWCVPLLVAVVAGCGAGYRTTTKNGHETVYRVDEDGSKHVVYEKAKDGEVTIHDEADPRAQQLIEQQKLAERARLAEIERQEIIRNAPKRADDDPIYVVVHPMELSETLAKSQHSDGAVNDQYMENWGNDAVIQLVDGAKNPEWSEALEMLRGNGATRPTSDVEVFSRASTEEKSGINKNTGKLATMVVVVFEATITSNYLAQEVTVREEGNIFRNVEVMRSFTEKIKSAIVNQLGPNIPADRDL